MNKTLHLNLKRKWFDMILSGEKRQEYRDISCYWESRLAKALRSGIKTITFSNGYAKDRPQFVIELQDITLGYGIKRWGAEHGVRYFVISLGKILSNRNV